MPKDTPQQDALSALEARVAFVEAWLQIPAVHLPGYVAPEAAAEVEESVVPEGDAAAPEGGVPLNAEAIS